MSGLVPVVNSEVLLLAVAALAPRDALLSAVVLTTVGQMVAKWLLYLAGGRAVTPRLLGNRAARLGAIEAAARASASRCDSRRLHPCGQR